MSVTLVVMKQYKSILEIRLYWMDKRMSSKGKMAMSLEKFGFQGREKIGDYRKTQNLGRFF